MFFFSPSLSLSISFAPLLSSYSSPSLCLSFSFCLFSALVFIPFPLPSHSPFFLPYFLSRFLRVRVGIHPFSRVALLASVLYDTLCFAHGCQFLFPSPRSLPDAFSNCATTSLQDALPKGLAAKFEKHRRDAEADVARKFTVNPPAHSSTPKAGSVPPVMLPPPSSAEHTPRTSGRPPTPKGHRPGAQGAQKRALSRPRHNELRGRSMSLEDLDPHRFAQLDNERKQVNIQSAGSAALPGAKPDKRPRRGTDDADSRKDGKDCGRRQMFDKRTLRRKNRVAFSGAIQDRWTSSFLALVVAGCPCCWCLSRCLLLGSAMWAPESLVSGQHLHSRHLHHRVTLNIHLSPIVDQRVRRYD